MPSLQGQLLVASPETDDRNFGRAVILLVEHNGSGALGLVLNRPTPVSVHDALPDDFLRAWGQDEALHQKLGKKVLRQGGPCPGPLMVLHGSAEARQSEVLPGVHFAAETDRVMAALTDPPTLATALCFAGYSGWGPGQLEDELAEQAWIVCAADADLVFGVNDKSWSEAVRFRSRLVLRQALNPKIVPNDPSVN